MNWTLHQGDCLDVLPSIADKTIDALITDPPAGIGFMGTEWDKDKGGRDKWIAWLERIMRECLRCLRPGAWALVWALPRVQHWTATALENAGFEIRDVVYHLFGSGFPKSKAQLKPAVECWVMARRPGVSYLNIDPCRIGTRKDKPQDRPASPSGKGYGYRCYGANKGIAKTYVEGRWPANLICGEPDFLGDKAKFFYCPKASTAERNAGCDGLVEKTRQQDGNQENWDLSKDKVRARLTTRPQANYHPTVKALALMRYLCKLVTPSGGTVLDPFAGSGSTGIAAIQEGLQFIGIEQSPEYCDIARKRLEEACGQLYHNP